MISRVTEWEYDENIKAIAAIMMRHLDYDESVTKVEFKSEKPSLRLSDDQIPDDAF